MKGKGKSSKPMPKMPMKEAQMRKDMKKHQGSGMPKHK